MPRVHQDAAVALWSGVVSLPVADRDDAHIEEFKAFQPKLHAFCKANFTKYVYQLEKTEPANWHYQMYFRTERTRRRVYELEDGLIISCTPASTAGIQALAKYAMKAATRQAGPWSDKEDDTQLQAVLRHMPNAWRPWQEQAIQTILNHRDDRRILWYSDPAGSSGKTVLAKFLFAKHGAGFFTYGDARSILTIAAGYLKERPCLAVGERVMIFNLTKSKPRDTAWQDIYAAIESIKDGFFVPTKGMEMHPVCCVPPTVVVFANRPPQVDAMARDRFQVIHLTSELVLESVVPVVPVVP